MKHKLHMALCCCCCCCCRCCCRQVIENAIAACKHLQSMGCYDIEFCAEDASRWGHTHWGLCISQGMSSCMQCWVK
jgi:hypothetical protein